MTTDYIHPIREIVGPEHSNIIFDGADLYKNLANKCLDIDKAHHAYFSGTGKIFVMNCYEFQILFISYIHLLTQYFSCYVQVQVSLLKHNNFTRISNSIATTLIHFWIFQKS